jgi:hypothetical protein
MSSAAGEHEATVARSSGLHKCTRSTAAASVFRTLHYWWYTCSTPNPSPNSSNTASVVQVLRVNVLYGLLVVKRVLNWLLDFAGWWWVSHCAGGGSAC